MALAFVKKIKNKLFFYTTNKAAPNFNNTIQGFKFVERFTAEAQVLVNDLITLRWSMFTDIDKPVKEIVSKTALIICYFILIACLVKCLSMNADLCLN